MSTSERESDDSDNGREVTALAMRDLEPLDYDFADVEWATCDTPAKEFRFVSETLDKFQDENLGREQLNNCQTCKLGS